MSTPTKTMDVSDIAEQLRSKADELNTLADQLDPAGGDGGDESTDSNREKGDPLLRRALGRR